MDKDAVRDFFDRCAPSWDAEMIRNEDVIRRILDNAGVRAGIDILDVACGTGVLFTDYFERGVRSVTGIDLSPEMAMRAREKFPEAEVICADVEEHHFERRFDVVVVYNAFPHFPDPKRLIETLAKMTKEGGRLTAAHGMSRKKIEAHHSGAASKVSVALPEATELAKLFEPWFDVDVTISDDEMYQVAGTRK